MKFAFSSLAVALAMMLTDLAQAELKVAAIFGDSMVLQQQKPVPVWGWSESGSKVIVQFAGQMKTARADASGKWLARLDKVPASAVPQSLYITCGETMRFTNILVGEVWLASGQSNMEKPIGNQPGQKPTFNAEAELAAANFPEIRIFKVEKSLAAAPQRDLTKFKGWQSCNSNALNSTSFSAAAYFFGREIHTNLNVPVGLIESTWGGTRIEPWTAPEGFKETHGLAKFAEPPATTNLSSKPFPTRPMILYNAMIAPIAGFAMRGALWYQGESNLMGTNADNDYRDYEAKMEALVGGWRKIWDEGSFPFYFVQIAPYNYLKAGRVNSPEMLPEFWTIQSAAARRIDNTGMAVTTDLVDNLSDIHPRDKSDVGHRLALLALARTYDRKVICIGPVFHSVKFSDGKALLKFDHADGGLKSRDGQPLSWFTIAGADGKFVPAEAIIAGDTVEVSSAMINKPVAVRFAWDETAQPNLCNGAGLPAEPFRTED